MVPTFDTIPVIQSRAGVRIGAITIVGMSTKEGAKNDRGRLYADIVPFGDHWRLDVFYDYARSGGSLVMQGNATSVDQYFSLTPQLGSGMMGRAKLVGAGTPQPAILIPTFATDGDVLKSSEDVAGMPGYDSTYGLAAFHAQAIKRLLLSDLPGAIPSLFIDSKLSSFVPLSGVEDLPDLSLIQSAESLRDAQANLVKAMSAAEQEHQVEFAEMAEAARERFAEAMRTLTAANVAIVKKVDTKSSGGVQFGSWSRV